MSLIDVKNLSVEEGERIAIIDGSDCRKIYMACQKLYLFPHMMGLFALSDYFSHRKEKLA